MALETPCDFAKARYVDIGWLRKSWGMLVFVLGTILTLFLALSILFFIRSRWLPGAVTMLGNIVSGATMTWITTQRKTAAEEEEKAYDELVKTCGSPVVTKPGVAPGAGVMGFAAFGGIPRSFTQPATKEEAPWFRQVQAARQSGKAAREFLAELRSEK